MKGVYKNLGGTNMKTIQEHYKSTGSVEPKKKPEDWHYSKYVKSKPKPIVTTGAPFNLKEQSKDSGKEYQNQSFLII